MRVGVDSGGTFTDVVAVDGDGVVRGVQAAVAAGDAVAAGRRGRAAGGRRAGGSAVIDELSHSTTVATNALLERRGGPVALVTTAGFEDVLEIGRQARPRLYALHPVLPAPLVDAALRFGVDERLAARRQRAARADGGGAGGAARARGARRWPSAACARSRCACCTPTPTPRTSARWPRRWRRSGCRSRARRRCCRCRASTSARRRRSSTPTCGRWWRRISRGSTSCAARRGCACWRRTAAPCRRRTRRRRPARTLLSGPAAGVVGALAVARAAGVADAITLRHGRHLDRRGAHRRRARWRSPTRRRSPAACCSCRCWRSTPSAPAAARSRWLDEGGALKVGPESAGAEPGPAAYDRGGTRADGDRRQPRARAAAAGGPARRRHAAVARAGARGARAAGASARRRRRAGGRGPRSPSPRR